MALNICCACGFPLECDNLELVVTLSCPQCGRELPIELEVSPTKRYNAILTVTAGPYWIGEQFALPIGVTLAIGKAGGNWLSLESDELSDVHCRLALAPEGHLILEDKASQTGTWVGDQRIVRGKLQRGHSFRVGEFRFRFEFISPEGTTVVAAPVGPVEQSDTDMLPEMKRVHQTGSPITWIVRNRFMIARAFITLAAWLLGVFHACELADVNAGPWPWYWAVAGGCGIIAGLSVAGRRVALTHRHFKYVALGLLVLLALFDVTSGYAEPAIAALMLAACLTLLVMRVPTAMPAIASCIVGGLSMFLLLIVTVKEAVAMGTSLASI